ncbi:Retrovirus-related Pol polyprotein from transposon RE2 [Vitis vinifera]|uniref:Retrovirus-related Pol polyprotein from transposon RE2 n=1 Tax=Vitis vinifera TaxID=29760 RepID=A0A438JK09_VITVI|nr:Retrovirus-related Pol polyprotein from transposon RE2 [Vitis vinifera]
MATKTSIFSSIISGSPMITSEKLVGSENYLSWSASVELWFMGQGYEDHLVTQEADILELTVLPLLRRSFLTVMPLTPDVGAQQTQLDKFFMFLKLPLEKDAVVPEVEANVLIAPIAINLATLTMVAISYMDGLLALPIWPSPLILRCLSLRAPPHLKYLRLLLPLLPSLVLGLALPLPFLPLTSVLYTPKCRFNLISISKLTRTLNCSITFSDKFVTLHDRSTGKTIDIGRESQGLYHLTSDSSLAVCISTDAPLLIHNRLGHPSLSKFQKMVPRFSTLSSLPCESCQLGKHTRISFPKRLNNRAKSPFELIHTDVWGPCQTASTLGFQYFVTFIDDYSRSPFTSFMSHHGILHQSSCAHTPQQNGVAERKNRHLVETAHTILLHNFKRVIVVIPLRHIDTLSLLMSPSFEDSPFFSTTSESLPVSEVLLLPIVSPADVVPPRPLQVYHRRPRVAAPLLFAEAPVDSLPTPSASPAPALPSLDDLPIAIRKGTCSTHNPHPIYNFLSYHRLSSPYSAFVSAISSVSLPKSTHEALSYPGWRQAMVDEMAALHSNGTWDLVVLPSGKSTIGCRWVYAVKVGPDGQVDHFKARLVAKGYTQVYDSDYGDTFSLVAKIASVRLLLSMAAMCSWPLYQLDIKNAFLHGDLVEEVYMEQPPGFVAQGESGLVCRLKTWGKLKYFLGIEIAQSSSGVVLSQRKYALDILEETGMLDCKPVDTPMDPNVKLVPGQGEPLGDPRRYRRLVGKLNYLTITRPDISFPVSVVSQFLQSPCDSHWDAVIRILRYIKSTPGQGVLYENRGHTQSKKQDVVARSSAEAEYRAMALATCELIWLRHLLQELRFGKDEQMKLICDNQAALHIASNPVFHERTKHIEVDCHFIREKIASGCVATSFVNSMIN